MKKLDEGTLKLKYGDVSLKSLFDHLHQFIRLRSQLKNLELSVRLEGPIPNCVQADKRRIMQILLNLACNSIKYTFEGGVEIVGRMRDATHFVVEISDTGIGIDPSLLERIFSMFGLIDKKASTHETGVGIGLYLCKRLVDMMQGKIAIQSVQGRGTKCTVEIPVVPTIGTHSPGPVLITCIPVRVFGAI